MALKLRPLTRVNFKSKVQHPCAQWKGCEMMVNDV